MFEPLSRALVFGAYQLTIAVGILLLPAAIVTRHFGVSLPVHRLIRGLEDLHDRLEAET